MEPGCEPSEGDSLVETLGECIKLISRLEDLF